MNAKQPVEYSDFSLVSYPSDAYDRIEVELRQLYRLCEPNEPERFAPLLDPSWVVVGYSKGHIASFLVVSDTLEIQKQEPEDFEQKGGLPNEKGWFVTSVCGDNTHYYGLLEKLFTTLKSYAVARHYSYLLLHVSSTRPWLPPKYESQGFQRGKTFTENNETFVIMHMMLTHIYDVCMVHDLACAHCGNVNAAQLDKSLGLVFCDAECREASLDEELRDEPILTDVQQLFWDESMQSHVLVFTQASLKKRIKKKAKKAKKKLGKGKKKVKKKLKKPKRKLKKGPGKPSRPGAPGRPGAPVRPKRGEETEEIIEEKFSLQYMLKKHDMEIDELNAKQLYDLRPELETGSFGTYLVNFAISALSSRQNYPRLAAQVRPQLLESALELERSARS